MIWEGAEGALRGFCGTAEALGWRPIKSGEIDPGSVDGKRDMMGCWEGARRWADILDCGLMAMLMPLRDGWAGCMGETCDADWFRP